MSYGGKSKDELKKSINYMIENLSFKDLTNVAFTIRDNFYKNNK